MAQERLQLFDGNVFDEAIFDAETWGWTGSDTGDTAKGQLVRGRTHSKVIDYGYAIKKNVGS